MKFLRWIIFDIFVICSTDNLINQFGFKVVKQVEKGENVLISPYSIFVSLGIIHGGLADATRTQVNQLMGIEDSISYPEIETIVDSLSGHSDQFKSANRLYVEQTINVESTYLKLVETYFSGALQTVDFAGNYENIRLSINSWVSTYTNNKITDLLEASSVSEETKVVLVQASYFKDNWKHPFEETDAEPFISSDTTAFMVDMMSLTNSFEYGTDDQLNASFVKLPYQNTNFEMTVILPNDDSSIESLVTQLAASNIQSLRTTESTVTVSIPRFTMEVTTDMKDVLSDMGAPLLFTEADFALISDVDDLGVSSMIHKAFIEVNERGTEAAAATATTALSRFLPTQQIPHIFKANRPFLAYISDTETDTILFMTVVREPTISSTGSICDKCTHPSVTCNNNKCQCRQTDGSKMMGTSSFLCLDDGAQSSLQNVAGLIDHLYQFTLNLSNILSQSRKDLLFSPFGLFSFLSMASEMSTGNTKSELQSALGVSDDSLGEIIKTVNTLFALDDDVFTVLNILFVEQRLTIESDFYTLAQKYNTTVKKVDFVHEYETIPSYINELFNNNTSNEINLAIDSSSVNTTRRGVMGGTVRFKLRWLYPFSKASTKTKQFNSYRSGSDSEYDVEMMTQRQRYVHYDDNDNNCDVIKIPLKSSSYYMTVVLPKSGHNVDGVMASLNVETLKKWHKHKIPDEVNIFLPRFHQKTKVDENIIRKLGINELFANVDQLSIAQLNSLSFFHEIYINIKEQRGNVSPITQATRTFNVNKPFIFYITHESTGVILYWGLTYRPDVANRFTYDTCDRCQGSGVECEDNVCACQEDNFHFQKFSSQLFSCKEPNVIQTYVAASISEPSDAEKSEASELIGSLTSFTLNTGKKIASYGLYALLTIVYKGTSIHFSDQLQSALGARNVDQRWKHLNSLIFHQNANEVSTRSHLFADNSVTLVDDFQRALTEDYVTSFTTLNFRQDYKDIPKMINEWFAAQTEEKINDILLSSSVNQTTKLLLTGSTYIKTLWQHKFDSSNTKPAEFIVSEIEKFDVEMMSIIQQFKYHRDNEINSEVVVIPFESNVFAMIVILPNEGFSVDTVFPSIDSTAFERWKNLETESYVDLNLPRFTLRIKHDRTDIENLGLQSIFTPSTLTRMCDDSDVCRIADIIHELYIKAEETGNSPTANAVITSQEVKRFYVNKPFIIAVTHKSSGAIVMLSPITHPDTASRDLVDSCDSVSCVKNAVCRTQTARNICKCKRNYKSFTKKENFYYCLSEATEEVPIFYTDDEDEIIPTMDTPLTIPPSTSSDVRTVVCGRARTGPNCICPEHYYYGEQNKRCYRMVEASTCLSNNLQCSPGFHCLSLNTSEECNCNSGYSLNTLSNECQEDINECLNGQHNCPVNSSCENTVGSFICLCNEGFTMNTENNICEENIGCQSMDCPENKVCTEVAGMAKCECDKGYREIDSLCKDVDECSEQEDICPADRPVCVNIEGTYECEEAKERMTGVLTGAIFGMIGVALTAIILYKKLKFKPKMDSLDSIEKFNNVDLRP